MAQGYEVSVVQVVSAVVSVVAVLVALGIDVWAWLERRKERQSEQLADARQSFPDRLRLFPRNTASGWILS